MKILSARLLVVVVLLISTRWATTRAWAQDPNQDPDQSQEDQSPEQVAPDEPGTAGSPADQAQANPTTDELLGGRLGRNYVIGPEDVLNISVFDVPELKSLTVQVANDGTISLPLLGRVKAAGMTPWQLQIELQEKWGENYLQDPQVSIFVRQFHSQPFSVVGAVEKPGIYQLTGKRTLVEALAMAGGLAKKGTGAAGKLIYITRKEGFENLQPVDGMTLSAPDKLQIDLHKLLYAQDNSLNIEIKPFDIITVSRAGVIYVVGAVKREGGFVLEDRESVSVLQAVAMAQGFTSNASKKKARIIHRSDNGTLQEVPIDLNEILSGESRDLTLAANDILFVPSSATKAAGKRSAESIVGILSGLLIYGRL